MRVEKQGGKSDQHEAFSDAAQVLIGKNEVQSLSALVSNGNSMFRVVSSRSKRIGRPGRRNSEIGDRPVAS